MSRVAAYNHNFHKFTSSIPENADYAEIRYNEVTYILQPDKDGLFLFNTYEFSRELFHYKDDYDYSSDFIDSNQSKTVVFEIKIIMIDGTEETSTFESTFFNGVFQRWECPFVEDGVVNLSDIEMPYFEGYPFDYSSVLDKEVKRVLVDNGSGIGNDSNVRNINRHCEGYYLKWHNSRFGYSYYLFESVGKEQFNSKSLGNVREKLVWTDNYLELGKNAQRKLELFAFVDYKDREIMKSLAKSNEVYLYTGNRYDVANNDLWLEVSTDKIKVSETNRNNVFEQNIIINLPKEKTRTRI